MTKLEEKMVARGFYLAVILNSAWTLLEALLTFRRADELDVELLCIEQSLVSGNQPGKREYGAAGDIAGDFFVQPPPRTLEFEKSEMQWRENIAAGCAKSNQLKRKRNIEKSRSAATVRD